LSFKEGKKETVIDRGEGRKIESKREGVQPVRHVMRGGRVVIIRQGSGVKR